MSEKISLDSSDVLNLIREIYKLGFKINTIFNFANVIITIYALATLHRQRRLVIFTFTHGYM